MLVFGTRGGEGPMVWDLAAGRRLSPPRGPECRFQGVAFPPAAKRRIIAFGVQGQSLVVWDLLGGKRISSDSGHCSTISALTFRADGRGLFTTAADGRLIEWDLAGREVRRLERARSSPPLGGFGRRPMRAGGFGQAEGVFSPGGAYLVGGERFSAMSVREVQTGQDVLTLPSAYRSASMLAFSRDGKLLAVAAGESKKQVLLFRVESGEELPACEMGSTAVTALAFDPSGKRLAVAFAAKEDQTANQGEIRVWRTDLKREDSSFKLFAVPPDSLGAVTGLVFSPIQDGPLSQMLLVLHSRGARLLDGRSGRELDLVNVRNALSTTPVFSPDGRSLALATSSEEGAHHTVELLELTSGMKRWSATVPAAVTALAFSPSGKVLATGHRDSTGLLWDVTGQRLGRLVHAGHLAKCWADLMSENAEAAFESQRALAAAGGDAIDFLGKRLRPAPGKPLSGETLARLVKDLDDSEFAVRKRAFALLAEAGTSAEPHLRAALAGKPSAEVARRARELLAKLGRPGASGETLRALRAVEVLEWIGTPAARALVEKLSRGRTDALLTRDALSTLRRLGK
jgi:WD40 repeat protein